MGAIKEFFHEEICRMQEEAFKEIYEREKENEFPSEVPEWIRNFYR